MQGAKDWAMDYLKKPETGYQEGEGRNVRDLTEDRSNSNTGKKMTLRVIELSSVLALPLPTSSPNVPLRFNLGSVKVEEYDMWRFDSN